MKSLLFILIIASLSLSGVLHVTSQPDSAEVSINGIRTGLMTPAMIDVEDDSISVSVHSWENHFQPRTVAVPKGDTLSISFTHLPILDTLSILGTKYYGILYLSTPPVKVPYLINGHIEEGGKELVLPEGTYHIHWDGGIGHYPVDTTITLYAGVKTLLPFDFPIRYGKAKIETNLEDAEIYLNDTLIGLGRTNRPFMAGTHDLRIEREGYLTHEKQMIIFPGRQKVDTITLEKSPDRDGDGFDDTLDLCPEEHGIYDGCPSTQKRAEAQRLANFFGHIFWNQPFTIEVSAANIQYRVAYEHDMRDFYSLLNDGAPFMNNYRGISILNKAWFSYKGFISSFEYSQHMEGLRYKKAYEIPIGDTLLYSDDFDGTHPNLKISGMTFQLGLQLRSEKVSFAVLTGYEIEHQILYLPNKEENNSMERIYRNNSHWKTTFRVSQGRERGAMRPQIYSEISFTPVETAEITGWIEGEVGVLIPWWK